MTIALWCVLAAAILPLLMTGLAKSGGRFDNANPRETQQRFEGFYKRAHGAHLNGLEAFPFFAAAVIVATMKGMPRGLVSDLAVAYIVARILYCALYVADFATLRSIVWAIALFIAIAIFTMPAWLHP